MNLSLRYGKHTREVRLPADTNVDPVELSTGRQIADIDDALAGAVRSAVGGGELGRRLDARTRVLVVCSDPTRGGTAQVLPGLARVLRRMGVDNGRIGVLVARGTHRSLTVEEKTLLRSRDLKGIEVREHDCDDPSQLSALVLTPSGTPVRINRAVRDADLIILLSGISFHYFAGFGGGRKLILPGCADRAAILANHRLALVPGPPAELHAGCRPGNLSGNPVHEDMVAALTALTGVFAINYFCDAEGCAVFVNAGDPVVSHAEACEAYSTDHAVPVVAGEIVVASCGGYPYDVNFLQAHKALRHAARACHPGGTILLFARCAEQVGSPSLKRAMELPRDLFFRTAHSDYDLNNQTGVSLLGLTERYRVGMVTGLDPDLLARAGIEAIENVEAFLATALDSARSRRVVFLPYASRTLPTDPGSGEL